MVTSQGAAQGTLPYQRQAASRWWAELLASVTQLMGGGRGRLGMPERQGLGLFGYFITHLGTKSLIPSVSFKNLM